MSWFPTSESSSPPCGGHVHREWVADDEAVEGTQGQVRVERRGIFWLSAAAVATVLGHGRARDPAPRAAPQDPQDPLADLDFAQVLDQIYPTARRAVRGANEEAYLMGVASALSRLNADSRSADGVGSLRAAMRAFRERHAEDGEARFPLMAIAMSLKPGGGFAPHDHRDYNGVIMGLEGEVRIRNYEILGDVAVPPKGEAFEVRQTVDRVIGPGRISTLARRRDNIHDLVAGADGARVLDVFTFYDKAAGSHYVEIDERPVDAERRVHRAHWKA